MDPRRLSSGRKRDIGAIVGGVIGGVVAIVAVIGVVTFVQRRRTRRRGRPKSVLSSTDSFDVGLHAIVTPFDPNLNSYDGTRDTRTLPEQQPLVAENQDIEMDVRQNRYSLPSPPPAVHPLPRPVAPVPVGLSDKEIARLRAQSQPPQSPPPAVHPLPQPVAPVPVGLSAKEIARLRAQTLGSRQSQSRSTLDVPQAEASTSSANAATGSGEASSSSYDPRRLHSEVESLRREMEQLREIERLRAEGLVIEAPPSYTEGDR